MTKAYRSKKRAYSAFDTKSYLPRSFEDSVVLQYFNAHKKTPATPENIAFNINLPPHIVVRSCNGLASQRILQNVGEHRYIYDPEDIRPSLRRRLERFYDRFEERRFPRFMQSMRNT